MIILGRTYFGADNCYSPAITYINNINEVKISNAEFDSLMLTKDTTKEESYIIDTAWDRNTFIASDFSDSINAGNVNFALSNTSDIVLKKREKGTYAWTTIFHKVISTIDDFSFVFIDKYCRNNVPYEYVCVGMLNGVETSSYVIQEVKSQFCGHFICDKDTICGTFLDTGYADTTRNHKLTRQEIPNKKYPSSYSFSKANYDSGDIIGYFCEYDVATNTYKTEQSTLYGQGIIDYLTDNKPKIYKVDDGRMWLISIDGDNTYTVNGHVDHKIIKTSWFESGDVNSEKDLYDSGLSDIGYDFMSRNYT